MTDESELAQLRKRVEALESRSAPNKAADDKAVLVVYHTRPDGAVELHHMHAIDYNAIVAHSPLAGWSLTPPDDGEDV